MLTLRIQKPKTACIPWYQGADGKTIHHTRTAFDVLCPAVSEFELLRECMLESSDRLLHEDVLDIAHAGASDLQVATTLSPDRSFRCS